MRATVTMGKKIPKPGDDIFYILKNNYHPKILYAAKLCRKIEGKQAEGIHDHYVRSMEDT